MSNRAVILAFVLSDQFSSFILNHRESSCMHVCGSGIGSHVSDWLQ